MNVIKLNREHYSQLQHLFLTSKFSEISSKLFVDTYLTDSQNYHAYGVQDEHENIISILGFYESFDEPSWYCTLIRTTGNNVNEIKMLLDTAMTHNEKNGRFKFYSMFPLQHRKAYRRLAFSKNAKERYDYFDEFKVEAKHYPLFTFPWQILYNRTLTPVDSIVRCTFLKQQYRDVLYNAGRL